MNERRQVGNESLKTAGNTSTGFASTYVDQSVKIKMKRKMSSEKTKLPVSEHMFINLIFSIKSRALIRDTFDVIPAAKKSSPTAS